MRLVQRKVLTAGLNVGHATRRFLDDKRGLTVSAVILIGILVVAVAGFGLIAATKIGEAGTAVKGVTFGGDGG
jgi:hypothetical protein